jgi:hypothetical protein
MKTSRSSVQISAVTLAAVGSVAFLAPLPAAAADAPPLIVAPTLGLRWPFHFGGGGLDVNMHISGILHLHARGEVGLADAAKVECSSPAQPEPHYVEQCENTKLGAAWWADVHAGYPLFHWKTRTSLRSGGYAYFDQLEDRSFIIEGGVMTGPKLVIHQWAEAEGTLKARQLVFPSAGIRYFVSRGARWTQGTALWLHAVVRPLDCSNDVSGPIGVIGGLAIPPKNDDAPGLVVLEIGYLPTRSFYGYFGVSLPIPLFFD